MGACHQHVVWCCDSTLHQSTTEWYSSTSHVYKDVFVQSKCTKHFYQCNSTWQLVVLDLQWKLSHRSAAVVAHKWLYIRKSDCSNTWNSVSTFTTGRRKYAGWSSRVDVGDASGAGVDIQGRDWRARNNTPGKNSWFPFAPRHKRPDSRPKMK